jgi:FKBP-type peptidyl-prolyl cis-trans isomerase
MKKITIVLALAMVVITGVGNDLYAQSKKKDKKKKEAAESVKDKAVKTDAAIEKPAKPEAAKMLKQPSYTKIEAGTDYRIIVDAPGDVYPVYGDYLEVHLNAMVEDSIIFDTRSAMGGEPAPLQLQESPFRGDLMEALRHFTAGDSAQVRLSVDSLLAAGAPEAPWMKKGVNQKLVYNLNVVKVTPKALKQQMEEADAAKQSEIDQKLIEAHLEQKKIKATRTPSGLYYDIKKVGTGELAKAGQKVSVNYTGMLLNGEKFDSNVDPQFQHVQAFEFMLGAGNVIKGWDEGIALLRKGGKATLYIPSTLAYGKNSPSPKIPANSVLVFDVELVDIIETGSGQ